MSRPEPWSFIEFRKFALRHPPKLSGLLSRLCVEQESYIPLFVEHLALLLAVEISRYRWDRFISTGLLSIIQELASDSRMYESLKVQDNNLGKWGVGLSSGAHSATD